MVAKAGAAADGVGQGTSAKLGTKGPFSQRRADVCTGVGGGRTAGTRQQPRGQSGAQPRAGHCLSAEPRAVTHMLPAMVARPQDPPGSGQPVPEEALPVTSTCPFHPPQTSFLLGAEPSHTNLLGPATWV